MKLFIGIAMAAIAAFGQSTTKIDYNTQIKNQPKIISPVLCPSPGIACADPTGVADSSTAFQNAINTAKATPKGEVFCPPGIYKITTALTATTGFTMTGSLGGCVFNYSGTGTWLKGGTLVANTYDYRIEDVQVNLLNNAGKCLEFDTTHNVRVSRFHCEGQTAASAGATNVGITLDGGLVDNINTTIEDFHCNHCLIGNILKTTGGGTGNVTVVNYRNFWSNGDDRSGAEWVKVLNGNGPGSSSIGGNCEHVDYCFDSNNGAGQEAQGMSFYGLSVDNGVNVAVSRLGQFAQNIRFYGTRGVFSQTGAGVCQNGNEVFGSDVSNGGYTCIGTTLKLRPGEVQAGNIPQVMIDAVIPAASTEDIFHLCLDSGGVCPFLMDYRGLITKFGGEPTLWGVRNVTPNGNITAPKGALVCYPSGLLSNVCWTKETGSGNTGWNSIPTYNPATFTVTLPDPPAAGVTNFFNTGNGASTGAWRWQPGQGSAAFGGGLNLYQGAHSTRPGYFVAGCGSATAKFVVNNSGIDNGTDIFSIDCATHAAKFELGSLFVNLGTPAVGTFVYCTNCTITSPCAGAGSGAWAFRVAGPVWNCPF